MKIYFLKEDAVSQLKGNIKANLKNYSNPTNDWVSKCVDMESPFLEYKNEVNDFTLDMSAERPEDSDIENIKRIYTGMAMLTETDATDERLWSGLEHGQFWQYLHYRWSLDKKSCSEQDVLNRFFFSQNAKRSLITNTISKLWWFGKLTYDENRKNPFELTEYLRHDFSTRSRVLFSSNYSNNPMIVRALLSSLIKFKNDGVDISRETFTAATKYLNVLGGTYILDCFTEDELSEKITNRIKNII